MSVTDDDAHLSAEGEDGHVFVSYARADRRRAEAIVEFLEKSGINVWWDARLEGGERFEPAIAAALEKARSVVVLWSRNSVESNWVRDEAQSGADRTCLVPVSLDETLPPLGFRQFQLVNAAHWNGSASAPEAQQLLNAIGNCGGPQGSASEAKPMALGGLTVSRRSLAVGGAGAIAVAALAALGIDWMGKDSDRVTSLAVMPFANLNSNEEQAWFSAGLSNELRAALSRNPLLRVSAPTSSALPADGVTDEFELARKLGVANILRGTVQLAGETARISAELVQVRDGLVQWAESFDRNMQDILAVQSEIARTVAVSLIAKIAGDERAEQSLLAQEAVGGTQNAIAYEAYLRGLALYDLSSGLENDRSALVQFDAAIAADPKFAAAHAMRATMLGAVANATPDAEEVRAAYEASIKSAGRAIELAPGLARGHLALGFALANGQLNRKAAAPHYEKARSLAPGDADTLRSVATFFAYGPAVGEAERLINEVIELDPLNARVFRTAGYIALLSGDFPRVANRMQQALQLNPELAGVRYAIGSARYAQGDFSGALEQFRQESIPIFSDTGVAMTLNALGDTAGAREAYDRLVETYGEAALYQQAQVVAQWGQNEEALALLGRAFQKKDSGMLLMENDPLMDPLRGEPEFDRLLSALSA